MGWEAANACLQSLVEVGAILMERENHDADRRRLRGDPAAQHDAIELRHRDIDDREIGPVLQYEFQCRETRRCLPDEVEIGFGANEIS